MKEIIAVLTLGLTLGCRSGTQKYIDSETPSAPLTDLGWVDHVDSKWREVGDEPGAESVVQLGMNEAAWCEEGYVCYVAQPLTELRDRYRRLCIEALDGAGVHEPRSHYSTGAFTGVIVEFNGGRSVVSVSHGQSYLGEVVDVLIGYNAATARVWMELGNGILRVPESEVVKIRKDDVDFFPEMDLMVFDLPGFKRSAVALAEGVSDGDAVYAIVHVFGLPMKMSGPMTVKDCGNGCAVEMDMAVGGSGGAIFTEGGDLAGILVGSGLAWTESSGHLHTEKSIHPCGAEVPGCRDGIQVQRFVKAEAIRKILESRSVEK